ncbi:MAG TPA: hypothetical protein VNN80_27385 [Polyangiaceae bacterium]|nr:hypothetical protein [Polyangiaceae bacterium]
MRRDILLAMSLVSVLTRELGRGDRFPAPAGVALPGAASASSSPAAGSGVAPCLSSNAARRIAAGHVGDPLACEGYVERARRLAALALGGGGLLALFAIAVHPVGWAPAALLALAAGFDWARGRLGARVLIQGGTLVIRRGPWGGVRLRRADIAEIGFGARGRSGQRAPESFWSADFESPGASHLVVLRLNGKRPRRLIVPEAGVGEARAAVSRLRRWWASPR